MLYGNQRIKVDGNFGKPSKNTQYSCHALSTTLSLIKRYQIKNDKNEIVSKKNKKKTTLKEDTSSDFVLKDINDDQRLWTPSTCFFIESIGSNDKNNQSLTVQQEDFKENHKELKPNESNTISCTNLKQIENFDNFKINNKNQNINPFDDFNNKIEKNENPTERYSYLMIEDSGKERINLSRKNLYSCIHISGEEKVRLLNYQNNFISRIEGLSNFKNLVFLDFYNNNIERIQGLENLNSLRVLMLGRNKITKIEGLSFASKLDVLDLHNNEITEIENLNHLTELRILNLENNKINELANLNGLIRLSELNLKNNNISIVKNIPKLNNLKKIYLNGNKLKNFSDIESLSNVHFYDISFENNPISTSSLYRSRIISKFRYIKTLDGHRISEEEKQLAYKITKQEDEKRKENERITQKIEEKKKCINNIKELWKLKMKTIQLKPNVIGIGNLRNTKLTISSLLEQSKSDGSNEKEKEKEKENYSLNDSNTNNCLSKKKFASQSLLDIYNASSTESSIHYSSSSLFNSKDSLGSSTPLSSRNSYLNLTKNINKKGRNIMSSSNQKLISSNEIKNDSLTSYVEKDKDEIRLYGDIQINDKLDVSGIKTICFNYVHINNIIEIMEKLKKFTDLKKLVFSNNDFSSFNQLHSFSILRNIEEIDILPNDNPIVKYDNLIYYILYRLKHLPLKIVCKKEITEIDYENAELMFAGLQNIILKIPTNIIYHTSDLALPINFTGITCPMIKQYKSKYMNLETLTTLKKTKNNKHKSSSINNNKLQKNGQSINNKNKNKNKNNDSNNYINSTTKKEENSNINTLSNTNSKEEISNLSPSYLKNVIQQYVQLNSLFVTITQENISIRNKMMESGNFLKYNQFFSLPIHNDNEVMEKNYKKCKTDARNYINNIIVKSKEERKKSELFSKVFSSIIADGCRSILQKSTNINQTMEEALINIIQDK